VHVRTRVIQKQRSRWRDGRYRVLAGRLFSELQDSRFERQWTSLCRTPALYDPALGTLGAIKWRNGH
jgi:hypothetical protein